MKKLFAVILIILANSIFALAQFETPKTADWQTFVPTDEFFSVEVPVPLIFEDYSSDRSRIRFSNKFDETYFFIFSDKPKGIFQFNRVMDYVRNSRQIGSVENIGEFETEKFEFSDDDNFYNTILTAKSKNKAYVFQTTSPTKDNPAVERFFSSLKLNDKTPAEITTPSKVETTAPVTSSIQIVELKMPESNQIIGRGTGGGIGSGRGNGNGNPNASKPLPVPNQNSQSSGVKILSKPRANYTDLARFYGISGKVVLRLTFSANGTIGAVTTISKLPFGLTTEAIIAAKGIKFEPAQRDGVAYSVTKPVEYSFTLY